MFRKLLGVAVVMAVCGSLALSEEFRAIITKVDGGKVTFNKLKGFNKETKMPEKGDAETLPTADNVKVTKGKFDKEAKKMVAGDAVEGGLKNELFTKIGEKGQFAIIITDADKKKITDIMVPDLKKGNK